MKIKKIESMVKKLTYKKIKLRIWMFWVLKILRKTWIYYFLYKSYWNSLKDSKSNSKNIVRKNFMSINVDPGARIGHQMANYNASIWHSIKFNLNHTHTPFPNKNWERLLGFNFSSISLDKLLKLKYKKILLPIFNEKKNNEILKIKKIIKSYCNQKVIFFLEYNQGYENQYEVENILKKKFFSSPQRRKDKLIFQKNNFNIAVHIRAGDIMKNKKISNQRFLDINYFIKTINKSLSIIKTKKKIVIHIFAEKWIESFSRLTQFNNIKFCHNLNQYKTFLHFIYADLLITSKSSFSYKAALISNGIKVSPKKFWHSYPKNDKKWILIKEN